MSIAGNPPLKGTGARAWAGRAFGWWLGELRALYEDAARRLEAASRATITIEAGERYWILRRRQQSIGQVDWGQEDPALAHEALRAGLGAAPRPPVSRRLAAAVGALALVALASWPVAQQVRLGAIERELAALKPKAEAVLRGRDEQRKSAERGAAIQRLRSVRPPLVG